MGWVYFKERGRDGFFLTPHSYGSIKKQVPAFPTWLAFHMVSGDRQVAGTFKNTSKISVKNGLGFS